MRAAGPGGSQDGWQPAEFAGRPAPHRLQHLLAGTCWKADDARDDLQAYIAEQLGTPEGALIIDDTGFVKKGTTSAACSDQDPDQGKRRTITGVLVPGRRNLLASAMLITAGLFGRVTALKLKRAFIFAGAVASTVVLSLADATGASAAGYGHIWNDSPSVNECLATATGVNNNPAIMWTCDSEYGQQWEMTYYSAYNAYTIDSENNGCLSANGSWSEGARIWANTCYSGTDAWQLWKIYSTSGGYVELKNLETNYCLSVSEGSTANGANVIQWACQGTPDQYWGGNVA